MRDLVTICSITSHPHLVSHVQLASTEESYNFSKLKQLSESYFHCVNWMICFVAVHKRMSRETRVVQLIFAKTKHWHSRFISITLFYSNIHSNTLCHLQQLVVLHLFLTNVADAQQQCLVFYVKTPKRQKSYYCFNPVFL